MRLDWIIGINQGYGVRDTGDKQGLYCTRFRPAGSLSLGEETRGWVDEVLKEKGEHMKPGFAPSL